MDQAFEGAIAFAIFATAFSAFQLTAAATYASSMNGMSDSSLEAIACIVASELVSQNGNSSERWLSWEPLSDPDQYLTPTGGAKLAIKATCYSPDQSGRIEKVWAKQDPVSVRLDSLAVRYVKGIILDDGSFLRIEVYAMWVGRPI
ncbi:MAG: hypothetical protein H5T33_00460 [Candidatus Methanosuratus sp.]|nr:hypothetical protein [Candidatus Methanosuratincola sp.]